LKLFNDDCCCLQKRLSALDASVQLPKDGCTDVLDDRSQVVNNDGSVKSEVDVEDKTALSPVSDIQCSICKLTFSTRGNLTSHCRRFHVDG